MSNPKYCPNCGAQLTADSPEALCPKCLMDNAAWSQTGAVADDPSSARTVVDHSAPPTSNAPELPGEGGDFGGYRILHQLGRGGMGAVYEAEHVESGRRVALKVLSHKLDSSEARKRFIREGRLAASINHPNSVYVFGTEEIEGTPAIAMEIVPGGTLQEKVSREGPLPVPQAVDAILQVVAGLESAQAIGILHRDVKPSNCFVDDQGVAKIGDFGLSISTEARGDSHLTIQGSLLGTPAFSSPEQLRGDELNARSDMYSVGATLFYLLTGHAPFEEGNMVKLLSRVLEETPPNPRALRNEIPRNLAKIVLRCLAKTPSDRFKSYAELRTALAPYSSEAPNPATLALRFGAYLLDGVVLGVGGFGLQVAAWGNLGDVFNTANIGTPKHNAILLAGNLIAALYFGILEGSRGASIGKRLLRLRLVLPNGNVAGFPRPFFRAFLFLLILALPIWIVTVFVPEWSTGERGTIGFLAVGLANLLGIGVLFCTARRRNGYAGLHELGTGTRVVRIPPATKRVRLSVAEDSSDDPLEGTASVGPYHVIEPLGASDSGRWFLAYDTKLLRRVWVHSLAPGTPTIPPAQRNLNRQGRLRWITGRRSEEESWDAYEAPGGRSLVSMIADGHEQSWAAVRFWLLDLAGELAAAHVDGTTPETLAFDRVWVTADGLAKLFDFPAPGADPDPAAANFDDPVTFLKSVGRATVHGSREPLPLHARTLLDSNSTNDGKELVATLQQSLRRPARISRRRRLGITLAASALPLFAICFGAIFIWVNHSLQKSDPELILLSSLTTTVQMSEGRQREDIRRYIAHHYRNLVEDPKTWRNWKTSVLIDPNRQRVAKEAIAAYPVLTPNEITAAEAAAKPSLNLKHGAIPELPAIAPLVLLLSMGILYGAIPALLAALFTRRGLILLCFGAVVVKTNGQRAGRIRTIWRGFVAWSPFLLGPVLAMLLVALFGATAGTVILVLIMIAAVVLSLRRRDRSLQDRLAGTWLVPR